MISGLRHALFTGALLLALAACGSTGQAGTVTAQQSSAGPAAEAGAGLGSVSAAAPASSAPAAVPRNPGGAVLVVGPGHAYRTPCQAIAAAKAGDTVQIDAKGNGGYAGDVCGWSTDGLMIVGFNGRALVDDLGRGTAIMVGSGITAPVVVQNNILAGGGTLVSQGGASTSGNCTAADPRFADRAGFDYHLAAGSPCIDKGVTPGADAAAAEQYVHPLSHRARATTGAGPDPGAFE
ncbi:hypothetical protein [Dactylosporangium matsuzakiense]|uniref:hypothetical protein n=1 Tax=Dactylosporangium matsuzakiense TaxID=53360 RepID=UPI0021C45570|nr:hypothetical protein [Dactylosporangium matsuzakiense]UWZ41087.1 hypothetical protein Dmats_25565 [Dactylosporangium matsuzakiense]